MTTVAKFLFIHLVKAEIAHSVCGLQPPPVYHYITATNTWQTLTDFGIAQTTVNQILTLFLCTRNINDIAYFDSASYQAAPAIITHDHGTGDVDITVKMTTPASGIVAGGIISRYSGAGNYWYLKTLPGVATNNLQLIRVQSGVETILKQATVSWIPNTQYTLRLVSAGAEYTAYVNGAQEFTFVDIAQFNRSATNHGLLFNDINGMAFDDWNVTTTTPVELSTLAYKATEDSAAPALGAGTFLYVSPTGTSGGSGTSSDPWDLATGITNIGVGQTLVFLDGIYTIDASSLLEFKGDSGGTITYRAAPGARPIITDSNGNAPEVYFDDNVLIQYLWFGGTWSNTIDHPVVANGNNAILEHNTFFGYYEAIVEGQHNQNTYRYNRFFNCGQGGLHHTFYMSNNTMTGAQRSIISNNIITNGAGYATQIQGANNYTVQKNFIGAKSYGTTLHNSNTITDDHNITWSTTGLRTFNGGATSFTYDYNIFGQNTIAGANETSGDHNVFVNGAPSPFGTNQATWTDTDVSNNLGVTTGQLDAAVSMISTEFAQTTQQIHDDTNINHYYGTIRSALNSWPHLTASSLTQYRSDGTTSIVSANWTNESTVVLKFSMSSSDASDTLTPQVEIEENGTAFTNTVTNSGSAVAYSGSPVTGTVAVTGLSNGKSYHWQAQVANVIGSGSWVSMGGSPDFGVQTAAPTVSSLLSSPTSAGATITWITNETASSKVDYGLTSSYGSSTSETDTSPRVTGHSVSLSGLVSCSTYHYRVRSTDAATNETIDSDSTFTTGGCTGSATVGSQTASTITTASGGSLSLLSGGLGIALTIPSGFAASDANFQIKQLDKTAVLATTSVPGSGTARGFGLISSYIYQLSALTDIATSLSSFAQPITITIAYGSSDVTGIDESTLSIFRWDGSSWNHLSGCSVDTSANTVTCTTSNFSTFGLFGQTPTQALGPASAPSCNDTTPTGVPNLFSVITTGGSARLSFTTLSSGVTGYTVAYGYTPGEERFSTDVTYTGPQWTLDTTINSLAPNTTYYFKVRAKNGCTAGSWSNILSAKTLGAVAFNQLEIVSSELVPHTSVSEGSTNNTGSTGSTNNGESCQSPYTVRSGDSLWNIASRLLGDGGKYRDIIDQNKDTYPSLQTSNDLSTGWELTLGCEKQSSPNNASGSNPATQATKGTPAQNGQGGYDVKVKVTDTSKKPVEGATVTLHSTPQTTRTDKDGLAQFHNVEEGNHKVLIAYNGNQGEESIYLTGDVKEFDLNVSVKPQSVLLSPVVMGIIGVMAIAIIVLSISLIRTRKSIKRLNI